jgi:hypothetical protein
VGETAPADVTALVKQINDSLSHLEANTAAAERQCDELEAWARDYWSRYHDLFELIAAKLPPGSLPEPP